MTIICRLLDLYLLIIFVRIVLSWFPLSSGGVVGTIQNVTFQLTEPVLGPMRRVIPPIRFGGAAIDLSAMILILGYQILLRPLLGC
ncbi:MAG: YggT family protein [Acidimicrobiia bacterium]|nr:YggT family protein [Acidimicrobiia bacterium]